MLNLDYFPTEWMHALVLKETHSSSGLLFPDVGADTLLGQSTWHLHQGPPSVNVPIGIRESHQRAHLDVF